MSGMFPGAIAVLMLGLAGCGTVSSLDDASRTLDTYELSAVRATGSVATASRRIVFVDEPTSSAALATDRIVIKPDRLSVTYLADARWTDPAPLHVQRLLVQSLSGSGRFGFVTSRAVGPLPDYSLLTDLEEFEARVEPDGVVVVVRLRFTLVRDSDAGILATRIMERRAPVASDDTGVLVQAFDAAMTGVLRELVGWVAAGGPAGT